MEAVEGSPVTAGDKRRPVYQLVSGFYPGIAGEERQTQWDSKALIERGWSVRVLTRRHHPYHHGHRQLGELSPHEVVDGISLTRLYSRGTFKIGSILFVLNGLWHLMRRGRHGIYHARDIGAPGWLAVVAAYLLGGRSIIKLRTGRYGYEKRLSSRVARWLFLRLLRLANRVVPVNSEVEEMVRDLGIPERGVVRIPNAVDINHFCPAPAEGKPTTRQRLGLPTDKTVVLYVGRLMPVKGLDVLVGAWALLPEDVRVGALLVLVGDGEERESLLRTIQSLGLQGSVLLVAEQEAIRDYYRAADIFVLPSRTEGLSVSLIEAMACGLPVVASNVGGALDVVKEGGNGVLFESENHQELAQKLDFILQMGARRAELGMRARQTVTAYADLDTVAQRLGDLYRELS